MKWREPLTEAFSIYLEPGDFSTDNGVLFTVVAAKLGLIDVVEAATVVSKYEARGTNFLLRHPSSADFSSWDDHLAIAVLHPMIAGQVMLGFERAGWKLPNGNFLARIPIFSPTLRSAAGVKLRPLERLVVAGVFVANLFEKREETSGKQLLWLAARVLTFQGGIVASAIKLWRWKMLRTYPGGLRELMAIYYTDPAHPFREAAGSDFS